MTAVTTTDDEMVIIYTWWNTPYGKDGQKICHTISYGDFRGMVTPDDNTGKWRATVARTGTLFDDVEMARRHVEETIQRLIAKKVAAARATLARYHPTRGGFAVD